MPTILLVEDNEMNRDVLSRLLQKRGYTLFFAEDGQEAYSVAMAHHPDLILMDISLPIMDGYEVTRRLRLEPSMQSTIIIALTAHAMSRDRDRALASGCTDYETKPVEFSRLLAKIETHLGGGPS
ncbi:MAG: response regulator [Holophaga sp.]|nr:response regulator [Holophaga sp.]